MSELIYTREELKTIIQDEGILHFGLTRTRRDKGIPQNNLTSPSITLKLKT